MDRVHASGEKFRYHIWTQPRSGQLAWYNLAADIEVLAVAGGADGGDSSYDTEGVGGLGGESSLTTQVAIQDDYQIFSVHPGGPGEDTTLSIIGVDTRELKAGNSDVPLSLDAEWQAVLGYASVGGKGADNAGPVDGDVPGKGGAGGFKLKEPYQQQSYTHNYTTGGPYTYDCSYGARGEQYQSGTSTHRGDARPCNPCPGHAVICHGPCECNFAWLDSNGQAHWASRGQTGCPGGWYVCGCNCCVDQPVYSTRYHCDSGGSLSGTTCVRTCSGDNTQHHSETRWTDCVSGMSPVNRVCTDVRAPGGGKGSGGIVAIRYKFDPDSYVVPESGTGVPKML